MKLFLYSLFLIVITTSCTSHKAPKTLEDFVTEDASLVLKINNLETYKNTLNNNPFFDALQNSSNQIKFLNTIETTSPILLSLNSKNSDTLNATLATLAKAVTLKDTLASDTITYKKHFILKHKNSAQPFYATHIDSFMMISTHIKHLEAEIDSKKAPHKNGLLKTTDDESMFSALLTNDTILPSVFNLKTNSTFTNSSVLDFKIAEDNIQFNGVTKATDSTASLINCFKNTHAQNNLLAQIVPTNSDGFLSLTSDNFTVLVEQLHLHKTQDSLNATKPYIDDIVEVGAIYENNNTAIVLRSISPETTQNYFLENASEKTVYRNTTLYSFDKPAIFAEDFSPLISASNIAVFCVIDDFLVFANNSEVLENIIASHQNKTTFVHLDSYQSSASALAKSASILRVFNNKQLEHLVSKNIKNNTNIDLSSYKSTALQYIYDNNFAHVNGVISKASSKTKLEGITELFNLKLNEDIIMTPQFVTHYKTKQEYILTQDIKNQLYYISNTGKIIWKKQLDGPVLGKVKQVDRYKNGRLQFVFATAKKVYMLDVNGKDVTDFPKVFNDGITQPLSVFDYDNNKKYRFFVTQDKSVFVFDKDGKTVKGFNFKKAPHSINTQPQHFRMGNKDYIVIKTNETLHILNRRGDVRIPYKDKYTYSNAPVFDYKNSFTLSTAKGDIISINQNGKTSSKSLKLLQPDFLDASSKSLATLNQNKLTINNKTIELDFGTYTKPQIFNLKRNTYIGVTDLQTQKAYIFNSKAEVLPNYPVYGNSKIDLTETKNDQRLLTQGDSKSILLYSIK